MDLYKERGGGIVSFFVSDNILPGWYEIIVSNGEIAYVCIGANIMMA